MLPGFAGAAVRKATRQIGIVDFTGAHLTFRNNNKRQSAMFKHSKVRQAGLILFATTLILILPNLTKIMG
ncbi:hypothetical protein FIV36_09985 [Pseudomonas extremaustralis]|uniref:Uncharacterized protein n=2 Tax=Pseudomonas extremaustralis TaxID=359110 RepID=A0A5C5QHU1_9PSED|nr:hypothetical protein FIV36_09985 [Pseudomonas extremaustralis]